MTVYEFEDYKEFLRAKIEENKTIRGYQTQLANAAGCQRAFMSQVLHGHANLTLDHATGLCAFWNLAEEDTAYVLDLVNLAKAATPALQAHLKRRLRRAREGRDKLPSHAKIKPLKHEVQLAYYSTWYMSAICVLCSIPEYRTPEALARRLALPMHAVDSALAELKAIGVLVRNDSGQWVPAERTIHLPRQSKLAPIHQLNWRHRAWHSLQLGEESSFHYTTLLALSRADKERLQEMVVQTIDKVLDLVRPSPEEEAVCFAVDLFKI